MENSIEEDIKIALDKFLDNKDIDSAILIVEKFILGNYILVGGNRGNIVRDSLQYILSDYKRVLKENEELKNDYKNLSNSVVVKNYCIKNSIPIQKVKDKIEELKNNPLKIKQNDKYYYETHAYNKIIIGVLQELIEEREENNGKNI